MHIDENGVTVNGKTYNEATTNEAADEDSGSSENAAVAESRDRWENFPPVWIFHRFTNLGAYFWTPVYLAVLVAIAGQSFGMMICGLRVVTVDFRRPGIWRTIGRYAIEGPLVALVILLSLIWRRVLLHDKLTGTRVVKVERILARGAGTLTH